jgi:hypothetical protein
MGLDKVSAGDWEKDVVNCGAEVDQAYVAVLSTSFIRAAKTSS